MAFELKQDNNIIVAMFLRGDRFESPASYTVPGKPDVTGSVVGSLSGRNIVFTVNWNNGFSNHYTGQVNDDGTARGTTTNNLNTTNSWYSLAKFTCATPLPTPAPATTTPPPAQKAKATVIADVDVFDLPDGVGTQTGVFLRTGRVVDLVEPCRNDWCHVVVPEVAGGQGLVFQPGFLQVG